MPLTEQQYRDAGFTDQEISQKKDKYKSAGFSDEEISKAFGGPPIPPKPSKQQPLSPWGKWAETQKESLGKAVDIGGRIATGIVPPLSFLKPSWREEYKKAPSGGPLGPEEALAMEAGPMGIETLQKMYEGPKTKEQMLGDVTAKTLENIGLMSLGKPIEQVLKGGAKLVGKAIPPIGRAVEKVIPESFKTTAKKIFQEVKTPYEVEKGATAGLRKGAEKGMGELTNVEKQLYEQARVGTNKEILQGRKVNFDNITNGMNTFEETEIFGRLHPPEAEQIRKTMRQVTREISPASRTGKTRMTPEEMQDIIETGTGEFIEGAGEVKLPGTFTQARATRSWLSKEASDASKAGKTNLSNAYRDLKDMLELDLEKAVGSDAWAGWKGADAFKTRKHLMDEIFGWKGKAELKPGKYNFEKVKQNIRKIKPERFDAAGFSPEEIQALHQISDVGKFRSFVETHPLLKTLIPIEVINEVLGLKLPMPSVTRAGRYILGRAIGI